MKHYHPYQFSILAVLMLLVSCGLFDPSHNADPPSDLTSADPLNFAGLLWNASPAFVSVNYEILFADTIVYEQGTQIEKDRNRLIEHFKTIESKYPLITVEWQFPKGASFMATGVTNLDSVCYTVYLQGKNSGTGPEYTGYSYFTIYYPGDWQIALWADVPANPVDNNSFFNPNFTFPP